MDINVNNYEYLDERRYSHVVQICDYLNIDDYYITSRNYDNFAIYYSIFKSGNKWYNRYIKEYNDDDYVEVSLRRIDTSKMIPFENSDISTVECPLEKNCDEYYIRHNDIYMKYRCIEYDWQNNDIIINTVKKYLFDDVKEIPYKDFIYRLRAIYHIT